MSKDKKKIILLSIIAIVFISCLIGLILVKKNKNLDTGITSPDIYIDGNRTPSRVGKVDFTDDVKKISEKYPDVKGWIRVLGTNIDYPIFQTKNNDKYINTDRDGNKYKWGEVFLDYRCNLENIKNKEIRNTIIYGHNTTRDSYFTELLKYKEKSFFDKNKTIIISTKDKNYEFIVVAAYQTNTEFYYIDNKFKDSYEYAQFIYQIETKSEHPSSVALRGDESLLTLSTCVEGKPDQRFVVHAIMK